MSDGCTDGAEAVALDHGAILVGFPGHRGKGATLRAGFARAMELGPSLLVTMDADGQHDPADLGSGPGAAIGGPPCLGWDKAGKRMNHNAEAELLAEFGELVRTGRLPQQGLSSSAVSPGWPTTS